MTNLELVKDMIQTLKAMLVLLNVLVQRSVTMSAQKKVVQRSMTELPEDLVEEILCRVPATSLKRVRTTCQQWNRLYNDKRLARKHFDKAPKQFMVLMLTKDYRVCPVNVNLHGTVPFVERKVELSLVDTVNSAFQFNIHQVFHCDGLLLCTSIRESRIVVWNPLTGETRWVETGNYEIKGYTCVLGYNKSCNKSYKIWSFNGDSENSEIYEFNSDSWRILDGINPNPFCQQCVSLKGNIYMFTRDYTKPHISLNLLKFDFSTEKTGTLTLPRQWHDYEAAGLSVVREEKLSVLLQRDDTSKTEIWVTNKMDETKVVSWTKVLALDFSPDLSPSHDGSFVLDEEKKLLMCCERWVHEEERWMHEEHEAKSKDMIYIVGEDNKITQVEFRVDTRYDVCWPVILNYVPSLIQIEPSESNGNEVTT